MDWEDPHSEVTVYSVYPLDPNEAETWNGPRWGARCQCKAQFFNSGRYYATSSDAFTAWARHARES